MAVGTSDASPASGSRRCDGGRPETRHYGYKCPRQFLGPFPEGSVKINPEGQREQKVNKKLWLKIEGGNFLILKKKYENVNVSGNMMVIFLIL